MSKPLESQPKYVEIIKQIDENYKTMLSMRPLPEDGVRRYIEEFGIATSHNSNAIEGNTFTYDETRLLLKEDVMSNAHTFKEHSEIVGYKKAFDFLYVALKEEAPITEEFIKRLHSFIVPTETFAGDYRDVQVYIGDDLKIDYTPVPPRLVAEHMKNYVESLRQDIDANRAVKAANAPDWIGLFNNLAKHHIEYEKIHPFIDGNGRTGRLLLSYEMISIGLLPVDIRKDDRLRYYAALRAYDDKKKYSNRLTSATEPMAKLLAESELRSMQRWNDMFALYKDDKKNG